MTRRLMGLLALLGAALMAGCGGSSGGGTATTAGLQGVYTVNGGGGFNVDGTASFINTAQGNAVTARVFDVGKAPNWMAIRAGQCYVVNSVSNNIQVVDLITGGTVGVISTGSGSNPMKLALTADGTAYVTNLFSNTVSVIDLATRTVTGSIDVSAAGSGPTGIAIANNKVYVTLTNLTINGMSVTYGPGKVAVIPVGGTQVAKTIDVAMNPQDAAVDGQGRVHVACTGDYSGNGAISIIDSATDAVVSTVALGGTPGNLAVAGNRVFVADGMAGVTMYSADGSTILNAPASAITAAGASVLDVKYSARSGMVYAADFANDRVLVIDPAHRQVTASLVVGDGPTALAVSE